MPDPTPQQQPDPTAGVPSPQQLLGGGQPSLGGPQGGGFFRSLVGTLISGMATQGLQGMRAAAMQANGTPMQRAFGAGMGAQQQQQTQQDENTERQIRIALGKVNYLQTYHALLNADRPVQEHGYEALRDAAGQYDDQGKMEWMGGFSEKRQDLVEQYQKIAREHPDWNVQIFPTKGSTLENPRWAIGRVLQGPLSAPIVVTLPGRPDKGLPPMQSKVSVGTDASDGMNKMIYDFRNGLIHTMKASTAKPFTDAPDQITADQLRTAMRAQGMQPIANLDSLLAYANNEADASALPAKSSTSASGVEMGRDMADEFIRQNNINPNFDPKKGAEELDVRHTVEAFMKPGGIDSYLKAEDAASYAQDVLANPKSHSPAVVQLATQLLPHAIARMKELPTPKQELDAKSGEKAEQNLDREKDKAVEAFKTMLVTDQGKFDDLTEAMDMLNKGGAEDEAVAAIKSLRGLVGGGGVRITGAELNQIAQARGWAQGFDVWLSRASTDPNQVHLLSDAQRAQLSDILRAAYNKLREHDMATRQTQEDIFNAKSIQEIRQAQIGWERSTAPPPVANPRPPNAKSIGTGKTDKQDYYLDAQGKPIGPVYTKVPRIKSQSDQQAVQ